MSLRKSAESRDRDSLQNTAHGAPGSAERIPLKTGIEIAKLTAPGINELTERLFEQTPKIMPPEGAYNARETNRWKRRYTGEDKKYNENLKKYKKRKKMKEQGLDADLRNGWERLTKSGSLQTVYKICLDERVPFEVVFLALGESHWSGSAQSKARAGGYWQFMPATAKQYGLMTYDKKTKKWIDHRGNPEKSTRAAIRYLKDLYKQTYRWEGKPIPKSLSYTDSDRWAFAFWAYNRGPGKVKRSHKALKGNPDNYAATLAKQGRGESANYVNKMFGIRLALKQTVSKGAVKAPPEQVATASEEAQKTAADLLYEEYASKADFMNTKQKLQMLTTIKAAYRQDGTSKKHGEDYVDDAIAIIDKEIGDIKEENSAEFVKAAKSDGVETKIDVEKDGELSVTVTKGKEIVEADIVDYVVQPGDSIIKIATWLSGNPDTVQFTIQLLRDLNPEIEDIDKIYRGARIKVPGEYVEVPSEKLPELLKKYYPGVSQSDAEHYLKYLNGKRPGQDVIRPSETILVPVL